MFDQHPQLDEIMISPNRPRDTMPRMDVRGRAIQGENTMLNAAPAWLTAATGTVPPAAPTLAEAANSVACASETKGANEMSSNLLEPNQLEAMQLVRDAQLYEHDAQHASDGTTYVIYARGIFSVCDNGEVVETKDLHEAIRLVRENLQNNNRSAKDDTNYR